MKTTVEIRDDLFALSRAHAFKHSLTFRCVLERALQQLLAQEPMSAKPAFAFEVIAAPPEAMAPDLEAILRAQRQSELIRL
jgi:hypothetical protein